MIKRLLLLLPSPLLPLFLLGLFPGNSQVQVQAQTTTPPPDCIFFVNSTLSGGSPATISYPVNTVTGITGFDNRTLGCQTWTFSYVATATSGTLTSLDFQSATGAVTPGSYNSWGGTVATGINPNTSSVQGTSTFSTGCASMSECNVVDAWVKILLTRNNFVGHVQGVVYGYRSGYSGSGGGGGGGVTSDVNIKDVGGDPTVIAGVAGALAVGGINAHGTMPTGYPVLVGGVDSLAGNVQPISMDSGGGIQPASVTTALADGSSNFVAGIKLNTQLITRTPVYPLLFNGTTWDRYFSCTNSAPVTISAGTDTVLVSGVAATNIKICHIDFVSDTSATFTIRQGTGSTCGTGTATLAGAYPNIITFAQDYQPMAPLKTTVAANDICLHSSASATVGGVVIYAQY